jgi:hypothetical protein
MIMLAAFQAPPRSTVAPVVASAASVVSALASAMRPPPARNGRPDVSKPD